MIHFYQLKKKFEFTDAGKYEIATSETHIA